MKRFWWMALVVAMVFAFQGLLMAAEEKKEEKKAVSPVVAGEKAVHEEFKKLVPADKYIDLDQFRKVWEEVMAGKRKAYLIDLRTHPEFYAGHIPGTDHIHAGHMYTIPKHIPDPNAEIYLMCRTTHRSPYVGGFLYKYGYKNVYVVKDGVVGWMGKGWELCNQFMGKFKVTEYHQQFVGPEKDPYRIREFHPY